MKTFANQLKDLISIFWLGPFLVGMGLVAGVVSGTWFVIPVGLIGAGVVIIVFWLFLQSRKPTSWLGRRSTQVGANAFLATAAVLVILGLVNFLAVRYIVRIDLTENQVFTLAPQSQQVVRQLQQPVKVWVFDPNPNPADQALLENYQRQSSSNFKFEFVNPDAKPTLAKQFDLKSVGDVYLESGQRRQFLQNVTGDRLSEAKLTNGLEQLNNNQTSKIFFLEGHGEQSLDPSQGGLSEAVKLLSDKNFVGEPLNLVEQKTVPKEAAVVVVAGPRQGLFESAVKALTDYLKQGGGVLLMLDPNTNPKLDSLLQAWGVKLDDRLVINASEQQTLEYGPAAPIISQYGEHPITRDFGNRFSLYPLARPLELTPVPGIEQAPLLLTSPKSWAESNPKDANLQFSPEQGDRPGPLTLGVALSQPATKARLVVIGNSTFATNNLFNQQLLNGDVLLNSISWLSKRDDQTLSIRPKEAKNRRITLPAPVANLLGWTAMGILPLLGLGTAAIVWWRRR
ncbi:MAG: Gldg family protein [Leptolyngbyaceae bacterium]|nr:Gldg family protein [Leptolyngbyaceae bacterium]